jgi:hypothetical protein
MGAINQPEDCSMDDTDKLAKAIEISDREMAEIVKRVEAGEAEDTHYAGITKKEQAILKRFKRDHEAYGSAMRDVFSISARIWARQILTERTETLYKREFDLKQREEKFRKEESRARGVLFAGYRAEISIDAWKMLRSFIHPDKYDDYITKRRAGILSQAFTTTIKEGIWHREEQARREAVAKERKAKAEAKRANDQPPPETAA